MHALAFSGPTIQRTAAAIEDRWFARTLQQVADTPPVFITSLPRAGTTILLLALADVPGVATHRYRDMPFVTAPLLWSRLSSRSRRQGGLVERAHGDGIEIGYDSPEAFEEILWRNHWPNKYGEKVIALWRESDNDAEARDVFLRHFRKIVALRGNGVGRYVSKNNGNIARLELLPRLFPGAQVVVPLRDPVEHVASMARQHENFLRQHAANPFVKRYMRDIGHLEFGELHTPFAFPGFTPTVPATEPDYWLCYWIAAYEYVLARVEDVHVVSHQALEEAPRQVMQRLCERIGLGVRGVDFARRFHRVGRTADAFCLDPKRLARANEIHADLLSRQV